MLGGLLTVFIRVTHSCGDDSLVLIEFTSL